MRRERATVEERTELVGVIEDALAESDLAYNEHISLPEFIADAIIERVFQQLPPDVGRLVPPHGSGP